MTKLIFALAAASAVGFAVPASAQTFYTGFVYSPAYGYSGYGYRSAWAAPAYAYAPAVTVYAARPVVRSYVVVRERPVVRRVVRARPAVRYSREALGAYAYSPVVTSYDAPFFGVTLGRGPGYSWYWD